MDVARPAEVVCGLSPHDVGTYTLEVTRAGDDDQEGDDNDGDEEEEGKEGDGEDQEDRLEYGSSPTAGGGESQAHPRNQIWSEVCVVQYDDTGSDKDCAYCILSVLLTSWHVLVVSSFEVFYK